MRPRLKDEGFLFVYVMHSDGLRKIGFSNNPYKRQAVLRSPNGSAVNLEFLAAHSATLRNKIELKTHDLLREKRVVGEWFDVSEEEARSVIIRNIIVHDDPFCLDDLIDRPNETKELFLNRMIKAHDAIGVPLHPRFSLWFPNPRAGTNAEVAKRHGIGVQTAHRTAGMSRTEAIRRADRARHDRMEEPLEMKPKRGRRPKPQPST